MWGQRLEMYVRSSFTVFNNTFLSHEQALTKLIGHFLFMRLSRSVRHAQLRAATLLRDKVARQNRAIKIAGVKSVLVSRSF